MNDQDRQAIDGLFEKLVEAERRSPPRDGQAEGYIAERIARQPAAPYLMAQTIVMQDYALQQAQARIEELERQAEEVERQASESRPASSGGLFGSLFGSGATPARRGSVPSMPRTTSTAFGSGAGAAAGASSPAWGGAPTAQPGQPGYGQPGMGAPGMGQPGMAQQPGAFGRPGFGGGGGGFLAGAAQTAMGVAGGVLLGSAISSMLSGGEAKAAEAPAEPAADAPADNAADAGADDINAADEGGWFDGGGWFGGDEEI
ncbi:DUF2076 domain-containing protein [Ancylobacter sp. WKF20]|uniref:DUF2076 domain-containing protein n=1 Tax=Ancylobacter sp. WKF20 TaxID=3039801 RepID=UPI00243431DC|nr:DUF2076 domain-containing protein [Ancylobacter sp. WKF20]WGD29514.1 DUF2076 domain-containing protein [Ancylobacter sp. WKF20]